MTIRLYFVAMILFVVVVVAIHRIIAPWLVAQGHGVVAISLISLLFVASIFERMTR